jgi:hypothetical protein
MRTTLVGLALVMLSGCANTHDMRRAGASTDVPKPSLLQRLGLGRPLGNKPPEDFVPAGAGAAQLQGVVIPDDPTPSTQPAGEEPWKAGAQGG